MRGGHLGLPSFEIPVQKRLFPPGTNLELARRVGPSQRWQVERAVDPAPRVVKVADLGPAVFAEPPGRAREIQLGVWGALVSALGYLYYFRRPSFRTRVRSVSRWP
jgi:hypothetical protein